MWLGDRERLVRPAEASSLHAQTRLLSYLRVQPLITCWSRHIDRQTGYGVCQTWLFSIHNSHLQNSQLQRINCCQVHTRSLQILLTRTLDFKYPKFLTDIPLFRHTSWKKKIFPFLCGFGLSPPYKRDLGSYGIFTQHRSAVTYRRTVVVRLSALSTGRLYPPGNIPGTHFCYRLSRPPRAIVRPEGLCQWHQRESNPRPSGL